VKIEGNGAESVKGAKGCHGYYQLLVRVIIPERNAGPTIPMLTTPIERGRIVSRTGDSNRRA